MVERFSPDYVRDNSYTLHNSWYADVGLMDGCPIDCQYCFLKEYGETPKKPEMRCSPTEAVNRILEIMPYHSDIPIALGNQTDAFATNANSEYYLEFLKEYQRSDLTNSLIFITKRGVPDRFLEQIKKSNKEVVFYLSFSGLAGTFYERNVNLEMQKQNFPKIRDYGIPIVHYWRPFVPINSSIEIISEIYEYVRQYANCSTTSGLRLNKSIISHLADEWPELKDIPDEHLKNGEFWSKGAFTNLLNVVNRGDYPVFFGNNQCALSYVREKNDNFGHFGGTLCRESNCPPKQRTMCKRGSPSEDQVVETCQSLGIKSDEVKLTDEAIIIAGRINSDIITYLRKIFNYPVEVGEIGYNGTFNWSRKQKDFQRYEI